MVSVVATIGLPTLKPIHMISKNVLFSRLAILPLLVLCAKAAPPAMTQILVKPKASMSEAALNAILTFRGASQNGSVPAIGVRVIEVPAVAAEHLLTALQRNADVEYAEPDYTAEAFGTANDPYFVQGSQWHLTKIQAPAAWDVTTGDSNIVVAVVDSGVTASHPDLAGKLLAGYDFVANDSDPTDENGHGTAVAGVVAPASNNLLGIAGVAWANPILPVRVLDAAGSGNYSAICNGITYAADRGARIISLGGTASSAALQDAINYAWGKKCILIAAAGNNGNDIASYPAACNNVVAVSATDSADVRPTWSNFGNYVDVAAPGVDILSLYGANQYAAWNGTSFSSPVTSGVAALMASANPNLTNVQLVDLLLKNSDDIGTAGYDTYYGNGRVNASRAVAAAKALVSTIDTVAPVATVISPTEGSIVRSPSQRIDVRGTDNVAVTRLELYVDGKLIGSSNTATASFTWNTRKAASGLHQIQAYAYDAAGNAGASAITTVRK